MDALLDVASQESEAPQWLEDIVFGSLRIWHVIFISFGVVLALTIMICCCFRFRIPRTKQEIEADYQRRKIARKFRQKLAKIQNSDMDDMDLQKALELVRQEFLAESLEANKYGEDKKLLENEVQNQMKASLTNLMKV